MSDTEVLSTDERDALSQSVKEDAVPVDGGPRVYDLTSHDRIVRGRLPTLELINERYSRLLRATISGFLGRSVEVVGSDVSFKKFEEYVNSVPTPCNIHIFNARPLPGSAALSFSPEFVFLLVDQFFGGSGDTARIGETADNQVEFSGTELQLSRDFAEKALADLQSVWAAVTSITPELVKTETNPRFVNIASPNEPVVDCQFEIEVDEHNFKIHFVFQDTTIDPVRELLSAGVKTGHLEVDQRWHNAIKSDVGNARIDLTAVVGSCSVTVADLIKARVGDVLPFEMSVPVPIMAGPTTLFHGSFGVHDGHYAVRLDQSAARTQALKTAQKNAN